MQEPQNIANDARGPLGDAILESPPPFIDRRSVLVGGGLGIATTVLPSAIGAASLPTVEPSGAFSYPSGKGVLLHWTAFDTTQTPAGGEPGVGTTGDISGALGRGGSETGDPRVTEAGAFFALGVPTTSLWGMRSTTNTLTLSGDSPSPHLEWTITNGGLGALTVSTLVIHRLRNARDSVEGPLNLAFYVSTSDGFESSVLRRTAALGENDTRHLVVPLASGEGVDLAQDATLTVRAFPYSTGTDRDVQFRRYGATSDGFTASPPAIDTVDETATGSTTTNGEHICAFIGTTPG